MICRSPLRFFTPDSVKSCFCEMLLIKTSFTHTKLKSIPEINRFSSARIYNKIGKFIEKMNFLKNDEFSEK